MNIDLFKVRRVGLDQLDMCEAHGMIVSQSDPKAPLVLCLVQLVLAGGLGEHGLGRVPDQEPGSRELDRWYVRQIGRACPGDFVEGLHVSFAA
jgi:hypothetical protein